MSDLFGVLLVDDQPAIREGVRRTLIEEYPDALFGEAGSGDEALGLLREKEWSVVLLDISMPGRSGLEVLREIKQQWPHLPVLMLSVHPEEFYAVRVLQAGASGYLMKDADPALLIKAVETVRSGESYLSPQMKAMLGERR